MTLSAARFETEVARHALGWLFAGCAVGLLLSLLLLFPELGASIAPFTYGRWVPVHLDTMLYGWCSLPLIGLLMRLYLTTAADRGWARWALAGWSGSVAFGCLSWLAGGSSGKLFLEWSGSARMVLIAAMTLLGVVLAAGWARSALASTTRRQRARLLGTGLLLLPLLALPAVMAMATRPQVYPPYNPDSGGSTGGSLLGSSLGVVVIFLLTPLAMGLTPRRGWRGEGRIVVLLALHLAWFALLDHGNRSHHDPLQIASLASLAVWPPLLIGFFRRVDWPAGSRRWLLSLAGWGILLVATGVVMFLPGILESVKFTHVLVAHAHLAMACMCSSYLFLVLVGLLRDTPLAALLNDRRSFRLWHAGNGVHLASLLALGLLEAVDPGALFQGDAVALALLALRAAGGALVLVASWRWLAGSLAPAGERREPWPVVDARARAA